MESLVSYLAAVGMIAALVAGAAATVDRKLAIPDAWVVAVAMILGAGLGMAAGEAGFLSSAAEGWRAHAVNAAFGIVGALAGFGVSRRNALDVLKIGRKE